MDHHHRPDPLLTRLSSTVDQTTRMLRARSPHLCSLSHLHQVRPTRSPHVRAFSTSPADALTVLTAAMTTAKIFSGLPWWLFIPVTTITMRSLFTLPLAILQRQRLRTQAGLRPIVSAMGPILRLKLAQRAVQSKAKEAGNTSEKAAQFIKGAASSLTYDQIVVLTAKERRKRQRELFKEHNCQMWKNILLPITQIPVWIALSATFREISGFSDVSSSPMDPNLTLEGLGFATDLSLADPTGIMPIVLGGLMITNVEWNYAAYQLTRTSVQRSKRITPQESLLNLGRFGAVFLMAISTQAPAALALYWISSNLFSLLQNILLDIFLPVRSVFYPNRIKQTKNKESIPLFTRNLLKA